MPFYNYKCSNCNKEFEVQRSINDAPLTQCPYCDCLNSLKRVYNSVSVVYHGSGYYCKDHAHTCCENCKH